MDSDIPDLGSLRLDGAPPLIKRKAKKPVELYLRGPITWAWLRRAREAGPAALPVGLVLWHYRALKKATEFPVSLRDICKLTGLSRCTARRGLLALEEAGLIARTDTAGRKPRVELRSAQAAD